MEISKVHNPVWVSSMKMVTNHQIGLSSFWRRLQLLDCNFKTETWKCDINKHIIYVSYVLRSSGISRKLAILIVRNSQKKKCISIVLYCFENLQLLITLEPLVRFRWGFQQNVPLINEDFNQAENWKCHMSNFRLIPLDSITYVHDDTSVEKALRHWFYWQAEIEATTIFIWF